ncbi:MAG: cation:dicarboxylase symporter family transporter, partial [Eubacteriaceae bacterium]|nr:cation:dicarboxylase symporter family transporter [Eubacteriaceae bacterium]
MEKKKLKLLPRLLIGIVAGILLGSLGDWLGIKDSIGFQAFIKTVVTFTSLFSVFLNFIIPLLILTFVSVGLAELGKKANKLFGVTLLLAYLSTIIAGYSAFALGSAFLPKLIAKISGGAITGSTFDAFFTIKADPIFGVMSALILAFVLGLGLANIKEGQSLLDVLKDFRAVIAKVLSGVIIPIIPFYIAGTFCKIAAAGELVPTVIMFA